MAIISFTNYKRGQTTGCMSAVMRYTMQDKKAEFEGQQLVTGINCQPESVYADFMTTKRLYHKTDGVLFYHMVQSFPKGEAVDPVTAHAAALKLAEYYEGYEVLVCTHTDREHIHSHFLINSVNFDTGRKLHIAKEQLQELRQRNDMVCKEFSLPVFQPREQKQKTKTMTIGEYHTAARGQSKKLQLMNIINDCMRHASNREEFIALMESEGYTVLWTANRKSITYTTPDGYRCRDYKLHDTKYLKGAMEDEFRIRETRFAHGRAGRPPRRAPEPLDTSFLPHRLSLAFSPPWPTPPQPPHRSNRAHRRPRAVPACPTAPPSPTPSSKTSPERSFAPKLRHRPRLRRSPSEIPSAVATATARLRPRRLLRRNRREHGHLPILSSLSLELCSHRTKLTRTRRRTSSSPTRLRPSNGRTTVAISFTATPGTRSAIACPSPCSLATVSTTPVLRQPGSSRSSPAGSGSAPC